MAREVRSRKPEDKVTVIEPAQQRRSSRLSDAVPAPKTVRYVPKQVDSSSIQRPVREDPDTKDTQRAPKARQSISIAGVFKKSQKPKISRVSKKQHKRREVTPELDLVGDLQNGINEARTHLSTTAKATFASIHNTFNSKLQVIHDEDTAFLQHVSETAAILSNPLLGEKLETEIRKDGKRVVETVEIGQRVEAFKALIEQEEAKLKQAWKEWDEVQEEYIELGIDVFGAEAFSRIGEERAGYKREMELLDLEHNTRVEELEEEIDEIGVEAWQTMKTSEKELDNATRKEQARLLQALL
ncbi:uncharacterized protein PAC_10308 [Phialocephala subalpina]|uniref:Uncharacterized protein n=1 Tax=Phialocephala subalpina TaxID=576137 RepID=A0A1L7X5X4_9HELO|nr:uncharacterized protein PAC_10308 [Phialocephala subalpina]